MATIVLIIIIRGNTLSLLINMLVSVDCVSRRWMQARYSHTEKTSQSEYFRCGCTGCVVPFTFRRCVRTQGFFHVHMNAHVVVFRVVSVLLHG